MSGGFTLEVLSGPLDGKTWTFEDEIVIGRDEQYAAACITLDRYVSRKHARLRAQGGSLLLSDLDSRNGTRVNQRRVKGEQRIEPGTRFQVGRTTLRVTRS
ncbi:MAG TPA: FHA domain-containing protein [Candidatus Rubrimentiphilum sp.]|nr:FHA domain-containing protein [Candidatus Rubrimentiphilum sp.]